MASHSTRHKERRTSSRLVRQAGATQSSRSASTRNGSRPSTRMAAGLQHDTPSSSTDEQTSGHDEDYSPLANSKKRSHAAAKSQLSNATPPKARSVASAENRGQARPSRRSHTRPSRRSGGDTMPPRAKRARKEAVGPATGAAATPDVSKDSVGATHDNRNQRPPPPWQTLEYTLLVQIFEYASHPLDTTASIRWLLAAARSCKSFSEPALEALYKCPPLMTLSMAHNFANFIANLPAQRWCDYHKKVKALVVNIGAVATNVYRRSHLDVNGLVRNLPLLNHIDLYHEKDSAPYRQLDDNLKWIYPEDLFQTLRVHTTNTPSEDSAAGLTTLTRLKYWRWSERMMGPNHTVQFLKTVHQSPSFANLETVRLVNFQVPSLASHARRKPETGGAEDIGYITDVTDSLSVLSCLRHLAMESSTVVEGHFLSKLPKTIQHLELINCWDVTSEDFTDYLWSHGRELQCLTLHHNQSLNLSFLPYLQDSCPNLRALRMNFTYYNLHMFYKDSDPLYSDLLPGPGEPTWPQNLETIELDQLRQWTPQAAEMFFRSLVDSAPRLPHLRRLSIKATLDCPWRERSQLRDKWEPKFRRIFLRKSEDSGSTKGRGGSSGVAPGEMQDRSLPGSAKKSRPRRVDTTPSRRSRRIATSNMPASPSHARSTKKGLRRANRGQLSYRDPDTDEDIESESDVESRVSSLSRGSQSPPPADTEFIHGLCEVVDIKIDNQKASEFQYGMEDFLDGESSLDADPEWNSDEDVNDDEAYAW